MILATAEAELSTRNVTEEGEALDSQQYMFVVHFNNPFLIISAVAMLFLIASAIYHWRIVKRYKTSVDEIEKIVWAYKEGYYDQHNERQP